MAYTFLLIIVYVTFYNAIVNISLELYFLSHFYWKKLICSFSVSFRLFFVYNSDQNINLSIVRNGLILVYHM